MTLKFTKPHLCTTRAHPASPRQAATCPTKSIFSNGSGAPSPPEKTSSELAGLYLQTKVSQKTQRNFSPASSSSAQVASSSPPGHQQANARLTSHKNLLMILCGEKSLCFWPLLHRGSNFPGQLLGKGPGTAHSAPGLVQRWSQQCSFCVMEGGTSFFSLSQSNQQPGRTCHCSNSIRR